LRSSRYRSTSGSNAGPIGWFIVVMILFVMIESTNNQTAANRHAKIVPKAQKKSISPVSIINSATSQEVTTGRSTPECIDMHVSSITEISVSAHSAYLKYAVAGSKHHQLTYRVRPGSKPICFAYGVPKSTKNASFTVGTGKWKTKFVIPAYQPSRP
jgi:hypothetical protein